MGSRYYLNTGALHPEGAPATSSSTRPEEPAGAGLFIRMRCFSGRAHCWQRTKFGLTVRRKRVVHIGEKIVDFLAQVEDFQKKLWEKRVRHSLLSTVPPRPHP